MKDKNIIVVAHESERALFEPLETEFVHEPGEIQRALRRKERQLWIARELPPLHEFAPMGGSRERRDLLVLSSVPFNRRQILQTMFHHVVAPDGDVRMLPDEQIVDLLTDEFPGDYFIGGLYDDKDEVVLLYRGNLESVALPLSWFEPNELTEPEPSELQIIDWGQTVQLGEYEVGADTILYEHDADFRKRVKQNRLEQDDSFGASVRRLRLMRGLKQDDINGVTARTVRRIEQNETSPQDATRQKLAAALGVEPDELGSY
jgi:hypothetical protein